MTTDTLRKEVAVSFDLEGRVCTVGGIAKGSGMIHPNMATMLCFVTSDTAISPEMLRKACKVGDRFERERTSDHAGRCDNEIVL